MPYIQVAAPPPSLRHPPLFSSQSMPVPADWLRACRHQSATRDSQKHQLHRFVQLAFSGHASIDRSSRLCLFLASHAEHLSPDRNCHIYVQEGGTVTRHFCFGMQAPFVMINRTWTSGLRSSTTYGNCTTNPIMCECVFVGRLLQYDMIPLPLPLPLPPPPDHIWS